MVTKNNEEETEENSSEETTDSLEYYMSNELLKDQASENATIDSNAFFNPVFVENSELSKILNEDISELLESGYDYLAITVTYNEKNVISLLYDCEYIGGIHVYTEYYGVTYDILSCEQLAYTDIIKDTGNLDVYIKQQAGTNYSYLSADSCETWFFLTEDGLCFYFNVGDAAPRKEIVVPFTDSDICYIESCPSV